MKKIFSVTSTVIITVTVLVIILVAILMPGCDKKDMLKYYRIDENYTQLTGEIKEIKYPRKADMNIYVLDTGVEIFNDLTCGRRIIPKNHEIIENNGFFDEVAIGDTISYTTAVKVYWDGYKIPIVELWANDKCYLDFETGKENWLDYIENEMYN